MVQEHERGVGGWQAEWPTVAAIIQATGLATASMAETAEALVVDGARMRANIEATHGVIFAERAMMILGATLGRDVAHHLLEEAAQRSIAEGRKMVEVLGEMLSTDALHDLDSPEAYLGMAAALRIRLVTETRSP